MPPSHEGSLNAPSIQQKAGSEPRSAENLLEELADRVANEDVALLDAGRGGGRDAEAGVAEVAHLATALACQADDGHPLLSGSLDRPQDVSAVAARGDGEEDVPGAPVGAYFAREDLVVTVVVADRRQRRGISV